MTWLLAESTTSTTRSRRKWQRTSKKPSLLRHQHLTPHRIQCHPRLHRRKTTMSTATVPTRTTSSLASTRKSRASHSLSRLLIRMPSRRASASWCLLRISAAISSMIYRQLKSKDRELASPLPQKTPPLLTRRKTWLRWWARNPGRRRLPRTRSTRLPRPSNQTAHRVTRYGTHSQKLWPEISGFTSTKHLIFWTTPGQVHSQIPTPKRVCTNRVSKEREPKMTREGKRFPALQPYLTKTACLRI